MTLKMTVRETGDGGERDGRKIYLNILLGSVSLPQEIHVSSFLGAPCCPHESGPCLSSIMGHGLSVQGIPYPILYFALDCQDSQVPALHYTALSKIEEAMAAVLRYADWGYELPTLNHTVADENAVDKPVAIGESDGSYPELRGYGMKLSELGQIGTIPTLPHLPFEPSILEGGRPSSSRVLPRCPSAIPLPTIFVLNLLLQTAFSP